MLNIIYYAWINIKKNYSNIIEGQLNDVIASGISAVSKLFIIICCEDDSLLDNIEKMIHNILHTKIIYEIEFKKENFYEYYGIDKLYSIALQEPESYFLYFHSKGMFNYDNVNTRHIYETTLTTRTIYKFREVINLFENNYDIMKIGLFPSSSINEPFIWFNFYYIRGSYVITCNKPIITTDRYYYERWSGSGNNMGVSYNLYENNYKQYSIEEAGVILNELNGM